MSILVTGANGQLGRLVIDNLLARSVPAAEIVAGVRTPSKAADLAERGMQVVQLDYDDPQTVTSALKNVHRILLISGSEVGKRFAQHKAVIDAAIAADVELLVYTSIGRADSSSLPLAPEHLQTERAIASSGLPAVILRNNWYLENYAPDLDRVRETGVFAAAAGKGKVSAASRADYAQAAAEVLVSDGHAGKTYELAGDTAMSYADIAAVFPEILGKQVSYQQLSQEQQASGLTQAGLPDSVVELVTGIDAGIAAGDLDISDHTLAQLIGHPTASLRDALTSTT